MKLYFQHSNGQFSLVRDDIDPSVDDVMQLIDQDVFNRNPYFQIYYHIVTDFENGCKRYDVGSHTEFYYLCQN